MRNLLVLFFIFTAVGSLAQPAVSYTVQLEAKYIDDPTSVRLSWSMDGNATSYNIYRKSPSDMSFGTVLATVAGADTTYLDQNVDAGNHYEYAIRKYTNSYGGFGYVMASTDDKMAFERGDLLLLVESNLAAALPNEVSDLEDDLYLDGWQVERMDVAEDTSVAYIKQLILNANQNLDDLQMIYLLGHVPVPYSGNLAPDAHSNHVGAWPADVYYAELNGSWTDHQVNNVTASDTRNHNVPGDGKLDQSTIPSPVELMISRVDFANMPAFSQDEVELTKRYLDRVHNYKHGQWDLERRALVDDNFGGFNGEAFAANAWRNYAPLVGKDNIFSLDYRSTLDSAGYLFSYGCGGGSFTSANGIGNTAQLATDSLQTGFTMLFGSYFGDWDRPDNFLRAALAQGRTMSISWAGRPHWHSHSMGVGYPIGYATKLTQNNSGLYVTSYGAQFVHIAQLGDPSLRMEYPSPAANLAADTVDTFHVELSWTASQDPNLVGYNIYQKEGDSPWFQRNEAPIINTSFIDSCVIYKGDYTYMVKAVEYIEGFSGSYYNESLGCTAHVDIQVSKSADGIGDFVQTGSAPVTGKFVASYLSWVTDFVWVVDGETLYGNNAAYNPSGVNGDMLSYNYELSNVCSNISDSKSTVLDVQEPNAFPGFSIFPNPSVSRGWVTITGLELNSKVDLVGLDGRLIQTWNNPENNIQLPHLSGGSYLLRLENNRTTKTQSLIVTE